MCATSDPHYLVKQTNRVRKSKTSHRYRQQNTAVFCQLNGATYKKSKVPRFCYFRLTLLSSLKPKAKHFFPLLFKPKAKHFFPLLFKPKAKNCFPFYRHSPAGRILPS
ncbi:hypothetical protein Pelo_19268 [Pelomyxa schiedti]|nr:hypothetical protein Pelo_19268 [Pelomyxa schiedti]